MRLHELLIPGLIIATFAGVSQCAIPDEFAAATQQIPSVDVSQLLADARAAEKAGRPGDAADIYYKILEIDRDNKEAYHSLSRIMDNAELPDNQQRVDEVLEIVKQFDGDWQVHQAPHFIIIYNTDGQFARLRGSMLEIAHRVYFDQFRKAEQRPLPLREKLVCILFAERKPFIDFARKIDGNMVGWTSGYYSARNNWTVFYDDKDNPIFADRWAQVRELRKREAELVTDINDPKVNRNGALVDQARRELERVRRDIRTIENRIEAVRRITNASKTVHEATHQLAFNTGIMGRTQHYPFWIAEGMATNFEPDDPAAPFGPFHGNPAREQTLKNAVAKRKLEPLEKFIVKMSPDPKATEDEVRADYAHAWGLFNFLFRLRHAEMREYLLRLRDIPPGPRTPEQLLEEFKDAFGDLDQLQREFDRWLKRR